MTSTRYRATCALALWTSGSCFSPMIPSSPVGPDIVGRVALEEKGRIWATQSVHRMIGSHVIDVDGDVARCRASVVVYSGFRIASVGSTSDELRRVGGSWRIHRRSYTPDA